MSQTESYERARGRAKAKYGFYVHVVVFAAVMGLLIMINLVTSPEALWFIWPLMGWGVAVVLHGAGVFLVGDKKTIIDAMTEDELRHMGVEGNVENLSRKSRD